MIKYEIINSDSHTVDELVKEVNKYLADGWVCQGGVCVTTNGISLSQAMTKTISGVDYD